MCLNPSSSVVWYVSKKALLTLAGLQAFKKRLRQSHHLNIRWQSRVLSWQSKSKQTTLFMLFTLLYCSHYFVAQRESLCLISLLCSLFHRVSTMCVTMKKEQRKDVTQLQVNPLRYCKYNKNFPTGVHLSTKMHQDALK